MENPRRTAIGITAILLLALLVVAAPGGSVAVAIVSDTVQVFFLALIAYGLVIVHRRQEEWLDSLADRDRAIVYFSLAIGLLAIVGADRLRSLWNGGIVLVVLIVGICAAAIHLIWRRSHGWAP
jgi:Flp pilus assembly protein TadB